MTICKKRKGERGESQYNTAEKKGTGRECEEEPQELFTKGAFFGEKTESRPGGLWE